MTLFFTGLLCPPVFSCPILRNSLSRYSHICGVDGFLRSENRAAYFMIDQNSGVFLSKILTPY